MFNDLLRINGNGRDESTAIGVAEPDRLQNGNTDQHIVPVLKTVFMMVNDRDMFFFKAGSSILL